MLTLTENASTIVKDIAERTGGAEGAGLRISTDPGVNAAFAIAAADHAEPGDQVVEQGGATIYLEESAAQLLDDKILDAAVDEQGQVEFALALQP